MRTNDTIWDAHWDLFSEACGRKPGYVTELTNYSCSLDTNETIEFRRWIRMLIRDPQSNLMIAAIGCVVRCINTPPPPTKTGNITAYRYRVEFTFPFNLARLNGSVLQNAEEETVRHAPQASA
ncbi:hypothetical protein WDW37_19970 [Bdellovibrionota bacterium FG-1]